MSNRLPPIPTPPGLLWRQARLQYLPIVAFAIGLVAAAMLWTRWVAPPTMVGEAEAIRTELRSAQAGTLARLDVDLLQSVTAGQVLGYVHVNDPKVLEASLAMIRAEIELMRTTMDPVIGQQRAALDREQLRLEWMSKRVELAALKGELQQAESTLTRSARLHGTRMITEDDYELARNARDTLAAQVQAQTELIARLEPGVRAFDADDEVMRAPGAGLRAAINHKEQELRLLEAQLGPVPLVAPIDGVVTLILRRSGETVTAGEPILQVSAPRSDRIVAFIRQPISREPKPGMEVEVRTRTLQRQIGIARVAQVGVQLEPLTPTLLAAMRLPITTVPTEFGIRVHVTSPKGLTLRPGENVDLILRD